MLITADIRTKFDELRDCKAVVYDIEHRADRLDPDFVEYLQDESNCESLEEIKEWYIRKVDEIQNEINDLTWQRIQEQETKGEL